MWSEQKSENQTYWPELGSALFCPSVFEFSDHVEQHSRRVKWFSSIEVQTDVHLPISRPLPTLQAAVDQQNVVCRTVYIIDNRDRNKCVDESNAISSLSLERGDKYWNSNVTV